MNVSLHTPQTIQGSLDIKVMQEGQPICVIFSMTTEYEGLKRPTVTLEIHKKDGESIYLSHEYRVGEAGKCVENTWRFPPMLYPEMEYTVHLTVPEGESLRVLACEARYETATERIASEVEFDAHLGFFGIAPENTLPAVRQAGLCGFDSCIVVPKLTKDGVFVCIHDDTINRTALDQDGNPPKTPMRVSEMTYEELRKWDFGSYKSSLYKGTPILKLEDFFKECAAYGMKPIFSIHPDFCEEEWRQIKKMLADHNLLKSFKVKSTGMDVLKNVFEVFGNEINGYILWSKTYNDTLIERLKGLPLDLSRVCGVIEVVEKLDVPQLNMENVKKIKEAGFKASAISCWGRKTGDYYKRLLDIGVSEFTEDYHCSFGLNW